MITDQCAILVGGMGTRLGDLTRDVPKPLLPVAGSPFLDVLVGEAVRRGFRRLLLLAGHQAAIVRDYAEGLANRLPDGFEVQVSVEPEPLGTGGALTHASDLLSDSFLLLNGDTWFDFNWLDLGCRRDGKSVMSGRRIESADRYESVEIAADGRVTRIVPRRDGGGPAIVNGGVYYLCKDDLAGFPERFSLESDFLPRAAERERLSARVYDGFFLDIGIPEAFEAAQTEIPAQRCRPAVFFDRDGVLNHDDGHVGSVERFRWIDGAREAVRLVNDLGYYVFIVTNQAGVARGYYEEEDVRGLHQWVSQQLRQDGAWVDDYRYCPYHPEAVVERYRRVHEWRKPAPGMIIDLLDNWPIDRESSFLIGDKESDRAAARAAGIEAFLFQGRDLCEFVRRHVRSNSIGRTREG